MKKISSLLLLMFIQSRLYAQSSEMKITDKDATQKAITLEAIHKITFVTDQTHALMIQEKDGLSTKSVLTLIDKITFGEPTTGVGEIMDSASSLNNSFILFQNYPNPFNSSTTIVYELSIPGYVRMEIYNAAGQYIATVADGYKAAGAYRIVWDGQNEQRRIVSNGVYFCRIQCENFSQVKKLVFVQ
jgi:hypothetical protein